MKKIFWVNSILLVFVFVSINAQNIDKIEKKIIENGLANNKVVDHLDVLCNVIGGRPIGSDAYEQAEKWAAQKFTEWGMEVIRDEAGVMPVGFNRGPWSGRMLGENGMELHFVTPSYTAGTKGNQIGHVLIEPKTQDEFNRMKGKLKGAWVLILGKSNGRPIDYSEKANKRRDSIIALNNDIALKNKAIKEENEKLKEPKKLLPYIEEPALFYKYMKEAGILGIIQSASVPLVALWDKLNINTMSFDNLPTIPDIKLDESQYIIIEKMAKERRDFFLEFNIRNNFRIGPIPYHNIIGIIKGTEFPNEYVILSAHLDSYDVATGGVDDGSGTAVMMEAARLITEAGGKPKRSIMVCLFAGEEFGLLGSTSWVKRNEDKLPQISCIFNRDGAPTAVSSIKVPENVYNDFDKIAKVINTINPEFPFVVEKIDPIPQSKIPAHNDAYPFAIKGVPSIRQFNEDFKGYNFDYDEIWHTERDLFNKSIPEYQKHSAIVIALLAYHIADFNYLLPRNNFYKTDTPTPTK